MSNAFDEMYRAVGEAQATIRAVDSQVERMARLCCGRLRKVDNEDTLAALKRELANYNLKTREWKP